MTGFLGDHPVRVAVRLLLLSLVVGWVLRWLDLGPGEIVAWAIARAEEVAGLGFDEVARFGDTVLLGAVVVVPLFLASRPLAARRH